MEDEKRLSGFILKCDSMQSVAKERVKELLKEEYARYAYENAISKAIYEECKELIPLGVASSFQYFSPFPVYFNKGSGAYLHSVDGDRYIDLSMGFGANMVGHMHPKVKEAISTSMEEGILYVAPGARSLEASKRLTNRFNIDQVRFCNSGTEALMYAVRLAKAFTKKDKIIKIEGGYHGGYDQLVVSVKPNLSDKEKNELPTPIYPAYINGEDTLVVPYNDIKSLEEVLKQNKGKVAAFVIEPVIQNLGIILPDEGYLKSVRELCNKYAVVLIFDEVKTGLTAGLKGAGDEYDVQPDLITLAKSIGGGLAVGAFGGKSEIMDLLGRNELSHFGTFNGNPLVTNAIIAVDDIANKKNYYQTRELNLKLVEKFYAIINEYNLPTYITVMGLKGCVTWSEHILRNYRDYLNQDFDLAELTWLWFMNRKIITPPGLDDQWLISFAHGDEDVQYVSEAFRELAEALREL
jgi:glutamate-1-semialdehyde 2,1-aminomutase